MDSNDFNDTLFNRGIKPPTPPNQQLFEFYKICIAATEQISNRRQTANSFFLTINTVLISFVSYLNHEDLKTNWALLAISLSGIATCYMWRRLILSYKEINSAKFKVILALEKQLAVKVYSAEWLALGEGKDASVYRPFTSLESLIPLIFVCLHVFVFGSHLLSI